MKIEFLYSRDINLIRCASGIVYSGDTNLTRFLNGISRGLFEAVGETGPIVAHEEIDEYGNFDSRYVNPNLEAGKKGRPTVAVPEIPLGWPTAAGVSEDHIYVCDTYNRRAVRADRTYAAEETCTVR